MIQNMQIPLMLLLKKSVHRDNVITMLVCWYHMLLSKLSEYLNNFKMLETTIFLTF
jgi:hypothetical protein